MIINSILDNDLYKFTMQHAVMQLFPRAKAQFSFINRDKRAFPAGFAEALQEEVRQLSELKLRSDEKKYLQQACPYLPPTYIDFLAGYRFDPDEVSISQNGSELSILVEGFWYRTILWEVVLMALVSELYFKLSEIPSENSEIIKEKLLNKVKIYDRMEVLFADFGTRRRYSLTNHERVVRTLKENSKGSFIGSSNVHFAHLYKLKPIGTHAHEWFMFHAACYGYTMANHLALKNWVEVYQGNLGIALSDTFSTDVFFQSFDTKMAKLFDGVRQDSGDPLEFADKTIAHYQKLHIDPSTKAIVFSDSLNPDMVRKIAEYCHKRIRVSFGIGTNLTNDVGVKPLNIVVKLTGIQLEHDTAWRPTIKLSDSQGKHLGPEAEVALCKAVLRIDD